MSEKLNLDAMSVDEMWQLYEEIIQILSVRLTSEKRELDKRLAKLRRDKKARTFEPHGQAKAPPRERRKYPKVFPKYRNPDQPSENWSGRGKRPRWLTDALTAGRSIDEFTITGAKSGAR